MNLGKSSQEEISSGGAVKFVLLSALVLTLLATGLPGATLKESDEGTQKSIPDIKVSAEGGSFTLSNLHLLKVQGSTKLKGDISNDTGQRWHQATFELQAFDAQGKRLRGVEEVTLFRVNDFDSANSMPLDSGYGVWLEGIPFESISRVEAVLIEGQLPATYKFALQTPAARDDLIFEDDALKMGFDIEREGIRCLLLKKSGAQVEVDWDHAGFIDPSGKQRALEQADVSLSHGFGASLYKMVVPDAAAVRVMTPRDDIYYGSGSTYDETFPLLPESEEAASYKGKTIGLSIPVNINGTRKSYNFSFKITDVEVKRFYLPDPRYRFLYEPARPNEFEIDE